MFVGVIVLSYPNTEKGGQGVFRRMEKHLLNIEMNYCLVVQPSQLLLSGVKVSLLRGFLNDLIRYGANPQ